MLTGGETVYKCTVLFSYNGSIIGLLYTSCNIFIVLVIVLFLMAAKDTRITVKLQSFLKIFSLIIEKMQA